MAKNAESRGKRPVRGRKPGGEMTNASKDRKQPSGRGRTSREEQRSSRVSEKRYGRRQSVAEMDDGAPSQQTSTAQEGSGQV